MWDRDRGAASFRVERDQHGTDEARREEFLRQLVRHERLLHAYIFSLVLNWTVAEELLQETYLRLLQRIDEWDSTQELYPWACGFAHYQVLTYRNRIRRDKLLFSDAFIEKVAESQTARSDHLKIRLEGLEHCLERLPQPHRALLELVYKRETPIEEAASHLGRSVTSTYQALARIRRLLKQCVERAIRSRE